MQTLLVQDKSTFDSYESFKKEFKKIICMSVEEFKTKALYTKTMNGFNEYWVYYGFILHVSEDDWIYSFNISN